MSDQPTEIDTPQDVATETASAERSVTSPPSAPPQDAHHHEEYVVTRRVGVPALLFIVTCLTTFAVGTTMGDQGSIEFRQALAKAHNYVEANLVYFRFHWDSGLIYMASVMSILLTHEMGHFLFTLRHNVPASFPMFIPMPLQPFGTMGAVIGMDGSVADRKQIFDIGVAGPLAGLVVAVPVSIVGIILSKPSMGGPTYHNPLLFEWLIGWLRPELQGQALDPNNPLYLAGWVGMLITGLNMMPISQLDGGHVIYALFGKGAHYIARTFLLSAIAYVVLFSANMWIVMLVLVTFIGVDHPPTRDDTVKIGPVRILIGLASLLIPVLCFPPQGIELH